ncbi:MAG: hypothetical protein IPK70_05835 [Flavobacteriales bacterium]|jgi:hypothetical protein|nr:hypothetical protein [Flavobacteriales bacterium]
MKPPRLALVLTGILLAHAASILIFRYFITIDGPVHVLHGSLLPAPWSGAAHGAQGSTYIPALRTLGNLIPAALLAFCSPQQAHHLFAALVGCAVVLASLAFLRAHGTAIGLPVLWLAPLLFSTLLILGLFHFLLGAAIGFGTVAWWKWQREKPMLRWTGLLLGAALAWGTHRTAPLLLCGLFLLSFAMEWRERRSSPNHDRRPWLLIAAMILLIAAFQFNRVLGIVDAPTPGALPGDPAFLLKSLFILDRSREQAPVYGIGALLLIAVAAAVRARWRSGRSIHWHDLFILLFLALAAVAWLSNSPHGRRLVGTDRAHWLALLALVLWLIAMADHARGATLRIIGATAVCAMLLNGLRLHRAESALAQLAGPHRSMMRASAELRPNSMVLVALAGTDRLQQHMPAFAAMEHSGIFIAPREFLLSTIPATVQDPNDWYRITRDPNWLLRHWRKGIPAQVDQILVLGRNKDQLVSKHPWPVLLEGRFRQSFENDQARIYTAVSARTTVQHAQSVSQH